MSGFIVVAFAGLLLQPADPHPSTLALYQAPAIRPFEPPSDFGRERAQGDGDAELHRRALEAPVSVDAYVRSYEFTPTDFEASYDQGVASAELRVDQSAGPLDGRWQVTDEHGRALFAMVIRDAGDVGRTPVEGGWRGDAAAGVVTAEGRRLTLEGLGVLDVDTGQLTANGRTRAVGLSRTN